MSNAWTCRILALLTATGIVPCAGAGGVPTGPLAEVIVIGKLEKLQGVPISASQGVVTSEQLDLRPVLRAGEVMEVVPGLIVTQHSGDGKANQYFLRGFNLDHGTDLATSVNGVPVNMPTHGHGQGYTDINFIIPELVSAIEYRKGPYYAETGNFSAAGAVNLRYRHTLDEPFFVVEGGQHGYARGMAAAAPEVGGGQLLMGVEYSLTDGPWQVDENYRKRIGVMRYTREAGAGALTVTAQGYEGDWRSTDQIPLRAVRSHQLSRYGSLDPSSGGDTHRLELSADWEGRLADGEAAMLLYALDYDLDLFSNFSYFTDPDNGDQFEQVDRRRVYGGDWSWTKALSGFKRRPRLTTGLQIRHDDIDAVGLYRTVARERLSTVREDAARQTSYGLYSSLDVQWAPMLRTIVGLRADRVEFDVNAGLAANAGKASDSMVSPKLAVVLGPWRETEVFFNVGKGFHTNDARGTTITVDPLDGVSPMDKVTPLVGALGYDVGIRTAVLPNTQISASLWSLRLDSELLFVGDAGTTEASRESTRHGVELSAIWNPIRWLIVDADLALSRSRFADFDPAGDHVPGAVEDVYSIGFAVDHPKGWYGGARIRHFGEAPLIEDNSVRSKPTTLVNLEAGYRFGSRYKVSAAVFNVLGRESADITYYYESQLADEAEPVDDIHFHPVEPRAVRVTLSGSF